MSNPNIPPGPGRPKGSVNKKVRDIRAFGREIFESKEWRESARQRLIQGVAPHVEKYLLEMVYGMPKNKIVMEGAPAAFAFVLKRVVEGEDTEQPAQGEVLDVTPDNDSNQMPMVRLNGKHRTQD